MLGITRHGEAAEIMPAMKRPRGRKLANEEVRRWRDILYALLTERAGLSPADAVRVLSACGPSIDHMKRRLQEIREHAPDLMAQLAGGMPSGQ